MYIYIVYTPILPSPPHPQFPPGYLPGSSLGLSRSPGRRSGVARVPERRTTSGFLLPPSEFGRSSWWFHGDFMVDQWWFNGDLNGDLKGQSVNHAVIYMWFILWFILCFFLNVGKWRMVKNGEDCGTMGKAAVNQLFLGGWWIQSGDWEFLMVLLDTSTTWIFGGICI